MALVELDAQETVADLMSDMGERARSASKTVALASTDQKNLALRAIASEIRGSLAAILEANEDDLASMLARNVASSFQERATLTPDRVEQIAAAAEAIAELPDPVGKVTDSWTRPNGLEIERVRTPLGVIGIIYESRPNVTVDAAALGLKSGNAVILRGGSDTIATNRAIHASLVRGLEAAGLEPEAVQFVPTTDRAAVGALLTGLDGNVDVIVPRGGKSLVERVQSEARVPVFSHLEGICHIYVDQAADVQKAIDIVVNSKMRRTSVCGAAETLLIDTSALATFTEPLVAALMGAGCEVRADAQIRAQAPQAHAASAEDWGKEFLDSIIAAKAVDGVEGALDHIARYGSSHTECIITEDSAAAQTFLNRCDSSIVMHNASTQFADGGEFGMGAEIGIATGRMHARGPVGLEQLTSFHYLVRGSGQTRP